MNHKQKMREFWKTVGLLSTILMAGMLIPLFMAVHEAEARPGRLTAASSLTVVEVTELTTNSEYVTNNVYNYFYTDSNDSNDTVIDPPGKGTGNLKIKGKQATTVQIGIVTPDVNATDDLFVGDDATIYGTAKFGEVALFTYDPNQGDITGSTKTIDWNDGNKQMIVAANDVTISFTAPAVGTTGSAGLQLIVVQDGTGTRAITWPGTILWNDDTEPTESTTAGDGDVFSFVYIKTGGFEKYLGAMVGAYNLD